MLGALLVGCHRLVALVSRAFHEADEDGSGLLSVREFSEVRLYIVLPRLSQNDHLLDRPCTSLARRQLWRSQLAACHHP